MAQGLGAAARLMYGLLFWMRLGVGMTVGVQRVGLGLSSRIGDFVFANRFSGFGMGATHLCSWWLSCDGNWTMGLCWTCQRC